MKHWVMLIVLILYSPSWVLAAEENLLKKGIQLQKEKKLDEAIQVLEKALDQQTQLLEGIHYNLGCCYQQKKDFDRAIASFTRASALAKKSELINDALHSAKDDKASLLVDKAEKEIEQSNAVAAYREALQLSNRPEWRVKFIRILKKTGAQKEAEQELEKLPDLYKNHIDLQ